MKTTIMSERYWWVSLWYRYC